MSGETAKLCRARAAVLERTRAMPTISGMPVVNPVLQSQHSFRAHRLDREIARQRGGTAEVVDGAVTPCCARNPGHPCAAFASVALQRRRNRSAAVVWGLGETSRQHGGVLDRHARALCG